MCDSRVYGTGLRVEGLRCRIVWGLGFGVWGLGFGFWGLRFVCVCDFWV